MNDMSKAELRAESSVIQSRNGRERERRFGAAAGIAARVFLVFLALVTFDAHSARAQSITLPVVFTRAQAFRNPSQQPNWINKADCLAGDILTFPVALSGYLNLTLQVWASVSSDCTQVTARFGAAAQCWPLYSEPAVVTPVNVSVSARSIVAQEFPFTSPPTSGFNIAPPDLAVCEVPGVAATQLTLFFMLVDGTGTIVGAASEWTQTGYDISPPNPPSDVIASFVNDGVRIQWSDSPDPDVAGYIFSCAAAGEGADCSTTTLLEDGVADPSFQCGSANGILASSGVAMGSRANEGAVAVAAVDDVGNVGLLSNVACTSGSPATDTSGPGGALGSDGGSDGGSGGASGNHSNEPLKVTGGCTIGKGAANGSWFTGPSVVAALALLRVRRTRRK